MPPLDPLDLREAARLLRELAAEAVSYDRAESERIFRLANRIDPED